MTRIRFFIDFDGTITTSDVVDMILERFASDEWRKVEKDWVDGKIGSRECLSRQIALVRASQDEVRNLLGEVRLDEGFVSFLKRAEAFSIPVFVASDGFDFVIKEVFERHLKGQPELVAIPAVFSNNLAWTTEGPRAFFSEDGCGHGCANCKQRIIQKNSSEEDTVVFVGDGLSDRFAARASDVVFAKGRLLQFCRGEQIPHREYSNFGEIENWLIRHCEEVAKKPAGSQ